MTILFLDDSPTRTAFFRTKYPEAICVTTSEACIASLMQGPYDLLCLDYDLAEEDTGMVVVEWLVHRRPHGGTIVIHSTNLPAAMAMFGLLQANGYVVAYVPFRYDAGGPFHL